MIALGLSVDYKENRAFRKRVRTMMALAFLPVQQAIAEFENTIIAGCPPEMLRKFNALFDYFHKYWIPRAHLWNMEQQVRRTNNNLEGWNLRFGRRFRWPHPNLWRFLAAIAEEQVPIIIFTLSDECSLIRYHFRDTR